MIVGFALLVDAFNIMFVLILNLFLARSIYNGYIKNAVLEDWIGYLAFLGTYVVLLLLGTVWTVWIGNGIIEDVELFRYFK